MSAKCSREQVKCLLFKLLSFSQSLIFFRSVRFLEEQVLYKRDATDILLLHLYDSNSYL